MYLKFVRRHYLGMRDMRKLHRSPAVPSNLKYALAVLVAALAASITVGETRAQGIPPLPAVYAGTVTVAGLPAPDGQFIVAKVGTYVSAPVDVDNGMYENLVVSPSEAERGNGIITFLLGGQVEAAETERWQALHIVDDFTLSFPMLPPPTPTPTVDPATIPPPTATPAVASPMTFASGLIVSIGGAPLPEGAPLLAKIGDSYTSDPAEISPEGQYFGLLVDPIDAAFIGETISFHLGEHESRTTAKFVSGAVERSFDLVFQSFPTATPTPEPTATPTPQPTPTPVPTATPVPPTATPAPTQPPPTVFAPTPEPEESNGGCGLPDGNVSPASAAANMLLLMAPLGLVIGMRAANRRRR